MKFNNLLYDEIEDEFGRLRGIEVGTTEYKTTVDGLTRLMEKAIDIDKLDIELEERIKNREKAEQEAKLDHEMKLKQMNEEKQDRLIKNCIAVAGIVVPVVVTIWGTLVSINFEKEGTITTIMGRGFISKLLPKK